MSTQDHCFGIVSPRKLLAISVEWFETAVRCQLTNPTTTSVLLKLTVAAARAKKIPFLSFVFYENSIQLYDGNIYELNDSS